MPQDLPLLDEILHSGMLSYGKWGRLFEQEILHYIGCKNVLVVSSYNAAMLITLTTLGIEAGDEIIASPMSCLASNQPFATMGIKVVWADIDPSTGTIDPNLLQSKITEKTKAIFHNHHCGYVGYVDEVNSIAKENGIKVVDDGIEAFGSQYKSKTIGNLGTDISVFSFETVRIPNCISGGAIIVEDDVLFERAKIVRDYGVDRSRFRDEFGEINLDCDVTIPGYGFKLNEINSYIGYNQMKLIKSLLIQQRANAINWKSKIENIDSNIQLISTMDSTPNYWVYGILVEDKKAIINKFRQMGFYASGVHLNNNNYSVFGNKILLKGVDEFYKRFVALPSGWWFNLGNE